MDTYALVSGTVGYNVPIISGVLDVREQSSGEPGYWEGHVSLEATEERLMSLMSSHASTIMVESSQGYRISGNAIFWHFAPSDKGYVIHFHGTGTPEVSADD